MTIEYEQLAISADKAIERAVLSHCLVTRRLLAPLRLDYFTGAERALFGSLQSQWDTYRDLDIGVLSHDHAGAIQTCLDVAGNAAAPSIERLRTEYMRRERGKMVLMGAAEENDEEALKNMSRKINDTLHSKSIVDYNHGDEVMHLIDSLEQEALKGQNISGFSTGISALDRAINGIEIGKFYVIGALKKTGKSRFMIHLALQLAARGAASLIDSLEMSATQLNLCALSAYSGVDAVRFGRRLTEKEVGGFNRGITGLHALTWQIHRDYTIADLWARADYLKVKKNISVIFVDFLQRLRDERYRGDRVREVENISQELANMSRELNIAVIALSQLRGEAENLKENEIPSMKYLKESHGIGENADCIIMLHNPKRLENPFTEDNAYRIQNFKILVEQRYGITGAEIDCDADLRTCAFCDKQPS